MDTKYIEDLFQYLKKLKEYYNWSQENWQKTEHFFNLLLNKSKDEKLYLGIVGEFSTGKSTFINALLGLDILKEDILQGTTCAPTMLCYDSKFDVEIHQLQGDKIIKFSEHKSIFNKLISKIMSYTGLQEQLQKQLHNAKNFIHQYTADERFAKNVSKVVLRLPCDNPIFQNGIVIVDTPGINAENQRHQEVTEKAIRDLCDLAIVLTPATAPCSQTLLKFIHEHLSSFQKNCICLANQIDRIRKRERDRQIKYIIARLQNEDIHFAEVYPVSAYYAIHHDENISEEDAKEFQEQFNQTMDEICNLLKANKNIVLNDKIHYILGYIVNYMLIPMLNKTIHEVKSRHEELNKNQLNDFSAFLEINKKNLLTSFSEYHPQKYEVEDIAKNAKDKFIMQMHSDIDNAASVADLKKIMSQANIENYMISLQKNYIQSAVSTLQKKIDYAAAELLEQFKKNFNNEFRNLARWHNNSILKTQENTSNNSAIIIEELETLPISVNNVGGVAAGGVAGAVIGTVILPGLGTILGSFIGSFIGSLLGRKPLSAYKTEAKDVIIKNAEKWCDMLKDKLYKETIQPYFTLSGQQLCASINAYEIFRPKIEEIIKKEKQELNSLQEKIIQGNKDSKYFQDLMNYINQQTGKA